MARLLRKIILFPVLAFVVSNPLQYLVRKKRTWTGDEPSSTTCGRWKIGKWIKFAIVIALAPEILNCPWHLMKLDALGLQQYIFVAFDTLGFFRKVIRFSSFWLVGDVNTRWKNHSCLRSNGAFDAISFASSYSKEGLNIRRIPTTSFQTKK
ncbi:hypothetical protein DAPPUDRAFT_95550 [Daphnia pulex]|uniref:Uncharacterized protein n=1 Tax=Daphnia pulex TaxID=6669 RepID=E9FW24_DAPPU|nr:hypothetical protein DAPPUDRAFT_95550 [Daphnia pulex]|eukprot:EFX88648.1 hypothetical protein DAPPUDRAFT_95550 [Daphnia pulex]